MCCARARFYYRHFFPFGYGSLECSCTKAILFRFYFYDSPDILMWIAAYFFLWFPRIFVCVCVFFSSSLLALMKKKTHSVYSMRCFWVRDGNWCLFKQATGRQNWRKKKNKNIQLHKSSCIEFFNATKFSSILLESDTFTFWCQIPYFICLYTMA